MMMKRTPSKSDLAKFYFHQTAIQVGDSFTHPIIYGFGDNVWRHHYVFLRVYKPRTRFGKPDVEVDVQITSVDLDGNPRNIISHGRHMWLSHVLKGLA